MELDLDKIRKQVEAERGPEWVKKHGDGSWQAAMAVIGEPPDLKRDAPSRHRARHRHERRKPRLAGC